MREHRFPVFDGDYKQDIDVIDGVSHLIPKRDVVEELTILEPADDRTDLFATVPVRSVWNPACGPAVEIGPFSLDAREVIKLHNAIAKHINTFRSYYCAAGGSS